MSMSLRLSLATLGATYALIFSTTSYGQDASYDVVNVVVDGVGPATVVQPGATFEIAADYTVSACAGCIAQIVVGLAEDGDSDCIYEGVPGTQPINGDGAVTLTAPTEPGLYEIRSQKDLQFSCPNAVNNFTVGPPSEVIGEIFVPTPAVAFHRVFNVDIDGFGRSAVVGIGASFDVTADFAVANSDGCPGCISQLVVGTDGGNADCLFDAVPGVQPGRSGNSNVTLTAPSAPGLYQLRSRQDYQLNCEDAVERGAASGNVIGEIYVPRPASAFHAVTDVDVNENGPTSAIVAPGAQFEINANWQLWNSDGCPNCISQIVVGTEEGTPGCLVGGVPGVQPGSTGNTTATLTAPSTPGVYEIRSRQDFQLNCQDAVDRGSASGNVIGQVTVATTNGGFAAVDNPSIDGSGPVAIVEPGTTFNVDADYLVWNSESCPNCVRQLVVGTDEGDQQCLFEGLAPVFPGDSARDRVTLTAPCSGGSYPLRYKSDLQFTCQDAVNAWTPATHEEIGTVIVQPILSPSCGDFDGSGSVVASDALGILNGSVGLGCCDRCVCDYDGSGTVQGTDALLVLNVAVGLTPPIEPSCSPQCDGEFGVEVGGASWFLGDAGRSCQEVCDSRGLAYDSATRTFAGSGQDANPDNCEDVLSALGVGVDGSTEPVGCQAIGGLGCTFNLERFFCGVPETTSDASWSSDQRACACSLERRVDVFFSAFPVVPETDIGSLQFQVDYSRASGDFEGVGAGVNCESFVVDAFLSFNDQDSSRNLTVELVSLGFSTGSEIIRCRFLSPTDVIEPNDFRITVEDAGDVNVNPIEVEVFVSRIAPVEE